MSRPRTSRSSYPDGRVPLKIERVRGQHSQPPTPARAGELYQATRHALRGFWSDRASLLVLHDRLVKQLRLRRISDTHAANIEISSLALPRAQLHQGGRAAGYRYNRCKMSRRRRHVIQRVSWAHMEASTWANTYFWALGFGLVLTGLACTSSSSEESPESCARVNNYPTYGTWESVNVVEPRQCTDSNESLPVDHCDCMDLSCAADETCVSVTNPPSNGRGWPWAANRCFELCVSDADCSAPASCVRNVYGLSVCATPQCRVDDDCRADPCGRCVPGRVGEQGQSWEEWGGARCIYSGACSADSCADCSTYGYDIHNCAL